MTAPPEHFADRPATPADLLRPPREFADPPAPEDAALGLDAKGQPHDLLSELLRSVRLSGERIVAYAPQRTFSISFPDTGTLHTHHISDGEVRARDRARGHIRARCARIRVGALALRNIHDGRPAGEPPAASLPAVIIAQNVGYTSEAAFSRAFKHRYGTPPARWRQDTRAKRP